MFGSLTIHCFKGVNIQQMDVTIGAGTAYITGAAECTPGFEVQMKHIIK
jgi:hypothetical protein